MKIKNRVRLCLAVVGVFWGSLEGNNLVIADSQQIKKDCAENAFVLISVLDQLTSVREKYLQKNNMFPQVKCKNCTTKVLDIDEFEGGLVGWALKAIGDGTEAFEKIRKLLDNYIKLLSDEASSSELTNFMLHVSNNMKQVCSHCHGVAWDKK